MLRTKDRRRFAFESLEPRLALTGFYVSPLGSDSAAGTPEAPWKTLGHAVASVDDGDSITLRAGTYDGGAYITKVNITIQSYPGERATLLASSDVNNLYFANAGGKALNLDIRGGFYGVKFDMGFGTVEGCKVLGASYYGIKVVPGADYVTIASTEVGNTGAGGIDDVNGDYLTVRDSYIHDTGSDALHLKGGAIGVVVERNRVENSRGTGITIGQQTGVQFFDPSQNPDYYEIIRPVVRNNVVTGTDYAGIAIWAAQGPQVLNNTLIDTALVGQGSLYINYMQYWEISPALPYKLTVTTDATIANNVVTRTAPGNRPLVFITYIGSDETLTLDHNRYYNGGADASFWDERDGRYFYGSFGAWIRDVRSELGSSYGDPGLDASGRVLAGSPLIDAGRTLADVATDFGLGVRSGAFDIGAHEFGSVVATTPAPGGTPQPGTGSEVPDANPPLGSDPEPQPQPEPGTPTSSSEGPAIEPGGVPAEQPPTGIDTGGPATPSPAGPSPEWPGIPSESAPLPDLFDPETPWPSEPDLFGPESPVVTVPGPAVPVVTPAPAPEVIVVLPPAHVPSPAPAPASEVQSPGSPTWIFPTVSSPAPSPATPAAGKGRKAALPSAKPQSPSKLKTSGPVRADSAKRPLPGSSLGRFLHVAGRLQALRRATGASKTQALGK